MSQPVRCEFWVMGASRAAATHEVSVDPLGVAARLKSALVRMLGCWVAGLCTVIIPLLHFVLPPTLFIIGIVLAVFAAKKSVRLVGQSVPCPKCPAPVVLDGERGWPAALFCSSCGTSFDVKLAA